MEKKYELSSMTVGILGMAFKADSDDVRSSLSYKLRRVLDFRARDVLTTDPHVTTDSRLVSLEEVLAKSDVLVLATPHAAYRDLEPRVPVVDVWNFFGRGVVI
jgi:UDP-N-acetyl-D-mannosaminuronic acid dehydrogenase